MPTRHAVTEGLGAGFDRDRLEDRGRNEDLEANEHDTARAASRNDDVEGWSSACGTTEGTYEVPCHL